MLLHYYRNEKYVDFTDRIFFYYCYLYSRKKRSFIVFSFKSMFAEREEKFFTGVRETLASNINHAILIEKVCYYMSTTAY